MLHDVGIRFVPFCAIFAAVIAARHAFPGWNGLVMVPKLARRPAAWLAPIPRAMRVFISSRPSILAAAVVEPNVPMLEVLCQPLP
jgi:hypothetical protein